MRVATITVTVRLPDNNRITDQHVRDAVREALNHDEEYDDQSLFGGHEYHVEVQE